jgi:hypothetical protein
MFLAAWTEGAINAAVFNLQTGFQSSCAMAAKLPFWEVRLSSSIGNALQVWTQINHDLMFRNWCKFPESSM